MYKHLYTIYIIVMASNTTSPLSEDNTSGTNLSIIPTEDEKQIDTTDWMSAKHKKLQHMKEFHEEYQCVFGERASICTIMKNRITHMNQPMPDSVCKEEIQKCNVLHLIMMLLWNISRMHKEEK